MEEQQKEGTNREDNQQERKQVEKRRRQAVRRDSARRTKVRKVRTWLLLAMLGLALFTIGINPGMFKLDRSAAVGFIQIGFWCFGLSLFLFSVYSVIRVFRIGRQATLLSDVGLRLAATGLVLAVAASYADFLGIGSHARSVLAFGPLQVIGMSVGILVSLIGLALYWPWKKKERKRRRSGEMVSEEQQESGSTEEG